MVVSQLSYDKQRRTRNSVLFEEIPCSVPEAREDLHMKFKGVHQSVSGYN